MQHFDYIFTGTGLAALLTVKAMLDSKEYESDTLLLIDPNTKNENDRTWSFWEKEGALFTDLAIKKWNSAVFKNSEFENKMHLSPYLYYTIKSKALYKEIKEQIAQNPNIKWVHEAVTSLMEDEELVTVTTTENSFTGKKVLNSIYKENEVLKQKKYPLIQQHFVGWEIETTADSFDESTATFMDFSVEQKGNTRFMYLLPFSKNKALIEYTLFSETVLKQEEYEQEIKNYITQLDITEYVISETEKGCIPMTCYPFWKKNTNRILNIGSAGGWTKASTGYTFRNAVKKANALAKNLHTYSTFKNVFKANKFWFYDLLLLDILYKNNQKGSEIFSALFKKGNAQLIFKFLDEKTTLLEDLKIILSCPKMPFIKALFNRVNPF